MRKTLERLKKEAYHDAEGYFEFLGNIWKDAKKMSEDMEDILDMFSRYSYDAVSSLMRYVQALEGYGYELDEEWDKLLKSIKEARHGKPVPKKEETKKTSYIK